MVKWILAAIVALVTTAAHAESFEMTGHFPATYREVSLARSIGIDRIGGRDGMALSLALEQQLSRPGADGRPYYDLVALSRRGPDADALVSGIADASVRRGQTEREVENCVQKQGSICIKKEKAKVSCMQETVSFSSTLRVARAEDGRILYTQTRPQTDTLVTCPDDKQRRSPQDSIDRMIEAAASAFVDDIVPRFDRYKIRLREERAGMDKATAQAFKDSIRLSQRDPDAACAQWAQMDATLPNHPSLLFNLGLCAERTGDYEKAGSYYARAPRAGEDATRVRNLAIGRADAEERAKGG
jgi:tetratricopeptide (TPR) repeat protein